MESAKKTYTCLIRGTNTKTKKTLKNILMHNKQKNKCKVCPKQKIANRFLHADKHIKQVYKCNLCSKNIKSLTDFHNHISSSHPTPPNSVFSVFESAFNRRITTFQASFSKTQIKTIEVAHTNLKQAVIHLISHQLQIRKILSFSVFLSGEYVKYNELGGIDETVSCFLRSQSKIVLSADKRYIKRYVSQSFKEIEDRNENFLATGSGWVLNQINYANIAIGRLSLSGGCSNIKVKWNVPICKITFLVDVKSSENNCFFNSVAVGLSDKKTHQLSPAKLGMVTRA